MSATVETREAAAGTSGGPRRAPWCGARTRAGGSCLGSAMANGRCRMHGGASTGPRTAVGLARTVAAKTTHGRCAASGAPRLDTVPEELIAPKHPSQVAFKAMSPLTPCNCLPVGLGRRALAARVPPWGRRHGVGWRGRGGAARARGRAAGDAGRDGGAGAVACGDRRGG